MIPQDLDEGMPASPIKVCLISEYANLGITCLTAERQTCEAAALRKAVHSHLLQDKAADGAMRQKTRVEIVTQFTGER